MRRGLDEWNNTVVVVGTNLHDVHHMLSEVVVVVARNWFRELVEAGIADKEAQALS